MAGTLRSLASWLWLQLLIRRDASRPDPERLRLQALLDQSPARGRHSVRVVCSRLVTSPAVLGWRRPILLVPAGATAALGAEGISAILAHELAHIRRHDYLINDTIEAGIVLTGDEVKSLRAGQVSLVGTFATIHSGELYLNNCSINWYNFKF